VREVPEAPGGVDLAAVLSTLRADGVQSVLVEGGAAVITSLLAARLVDRVVVRVSPVVLGAGAAAEKDLSIGGVGDWVRLVNRTASVDGDDVLLAWDVAPLTGDNCG
jgi:riboflavin biosynthesis pyrimidine reductase